MLRDLQKQHPKTKFVFADINYNLLSDNDITNIGRSLSDSLKPYFTYVDDTFDCNSFALMGCAIAKLANRISSKEKAAPALGYCYYTKYIKTSIFNNDYESIGRHCINCSIDYADNVYYLRFYEPQDKLTELDLCELELSSLSDVVFP